MKFLSWFQIDVSEDCLLFEYKNAIGICSEEINRQLRSRLLRPRQTTKQKSRLKLTTLSIPGNVKFESGYLVA